MMNRSEKRCSIRIPYWRPGGIESWLESMAEQGWELAGVKGEKARFRKAAPQHVHYYCRIFDSVFEESYLKRIEVSKKEIDQISGFGWTYVATVEGVGIFRSEKDCPRVEIVDKDKEISKLLKIYKESTNFILILSSVNFVILALNAFNSIRISSPNRILAIVVSLFWLALLIFALFWNKHNQNKIQQHGLDCVKHDEALSKR